MKILILAGFLGSGKTTLLLRLAKYISARSAKKYPLAILENEVGAVSVDAAAAASYRVRQLSGGCICCTLTLELGAAIRDIATDYDPDYLLVEASGMAMPASITEALKGYLRGTDTLKCAVLADAQRWDVLYEDLDYFLENQLRGAELILLNKCDLVTEDAVQHLLRELSALNPAAEILPICAAENCDDALARLLK